MRRQTTGSTAVAVMLVVLAALPYTHSLACELTGMNGVRPSEMAYATCSDAHGREVACHGAMACCVAHVAPPAAGPGPAPESSGTERAPLAPAGRPHEVPHPPHPPPPKG